jgi:hypothetical protein
MVTFEDESGKTSLLPVAELQGPREPKPLRGTFQTRPVPSPDNPLLSNQTGARGVPRQARRPDLT